MCPTFSVPLSETAQSCDIHALRGSSFGTNEKCQTPSSHVHPPSVHRSWLTLVVEHLRGESGRLWLSEQDVGTAWSGNPWQLRGGMTERGATGAGRPQIAGVPRVHRFLKLDGCCTTGDDLRFGQTRVGDNGIRSLTPPAVIHCSMVGNGPKLFHRWTKS